LSAALGKSAESETHRQRAAEGGPPPNPDPVLGRMLLIGLDLRRVVQEGLAAAEAGEFQTAEELLMKAIPLDTSGSTAQRAIATVRVMTNRLDEAASLLRAIIESNPKDASAVFQYADVLARQGRAAEALQQYGKVEELAPGDPRVPFAVGGIHFATGKLDEAKKLWTQLIEKSPGFADAYVRLAEIASKERNYAEYVRILKLGLERIPESPLLANGLAWIYSTHPDEKFRNGPEAVKLAERAVRVTNRRLHQLIDTLACAYAEVGRFDDAVKQIDEAAGMATDPSQKSYLDQYQIRQKLFREKKPFREEAAR
jgi:tetratricopeptide (TPR) repeat protein